jgi:hypothetical protein
MVSPAFFTFGSCHILSFPDRCKSPRQQGGTLQVYTKYRREMKETDEKESAVSNLITKKKKKKHKRTREDPSSKSQ